MLTAKGDDMDKILGLEYSADDYITKPFNILRGQGKAEGHYAPYRQKGAGREQKQSGGSRRSSSGLRRSSVYQRPAEEVNLGENLMSWSLFSTRTRCTAGKSSMEYRVGYEYPGDVRTVDVHIRRPEESEANPTSRIRSCTNGA